MPKKKKTKKRSSRSGFNSGSGLSMATLTDEELADVGDDSRYPEALYRAKKGTLGSPEAWLEELVMDYHERGGLGRHGSDLLDVLSKKYPEDAREAWDIVMRPEENPGVPMLRRQDALALARTVAMSGWKHKGPRGSLPAYWEKNVPGGELHIIESNTFMRKYHLQHVSDDGVVTPLGGLGRRATLEEAKLRAVLDASKKGLRIVNPQRVKNLAPARSKWIGTAIKHPGKLSRMADQLGFERKPFMARSLAEQKKILDACVEEYGYRSCLGSTMLLRNLPAISKSSRMRTRATALKDYLVRKYGGKGSFGPRSNPANGEWAAVPAILMHVDISKAKLTATQITQLTFETA